MKKKLTVMALTAGGLAAVATMIYQALKLHNEQEKEIFNPAENREEKIDSPAVHEQNAAIQPVAESQPAEPLMPAPETEPAEDVQPVAAAEQAQPGKTAPETEPAEDVQPVAAAESAQPESPAAANTAEDLTENIVVPVEPAAIMAPPFIDEPANADSQPDQTDKADQPEKGLAPFQPIDLQQDSAAEQEETQDDKVDEMISKIMSDIDADAADHSVPFADEQPVPEKAEPAPVKAEENVIQQEETAEAEVYPNVSDSMKATIDKQIAATIAAVPNASYVTLQHYVSFDDAPACEAFSAFLKNKGLDVAPGSAPNELLVIKKCACDHDQLQADTLKLADDVAAASGRYRGWGIKESM